MSNDGAHEQITVGNAQISASEWHRLYPLGRKHATQWWLRQLRACLDQIQYLDDPKFSYLLRKGYLDGLADAYLVVVAEFNKTFMQSSQGVRLLRDVANEMNFERKQFGILYKEVADLAGCGSRTVQKAYNGSLTNIHTFLRIEQAHIDRIKRHPQYGRLH